MKQTLNLKLSQQLTLTPQLKQSLKLLQLPSLDLELEIQQTLDCNPLLERVDAEASSADQVIPNSMGLDGTTTVDWNIVQLDHSISSGDRDISVLGLVQTDGTLTIADPTLPLPTLLEDNTGHALTVSHYLEIDGIIDLVGESQLIQTEGSVLDADSGGYIERDQQGTANGYNYNYWSSSVGPITGDTATRGTGVSTTNSNYTIAGI
jgi:hypothetical protein